MYYEINKLYNSIIEIIEQISATPYPQAVFNNPFGLDARTPGGQTGAQPISLDAIDQIQSRPLSNPLSQPDQPFISSPELPSRWQMQFALRYIF